MQRLAELFISFFCNKFNKFNNTEAGMLDSIDHIQFEIAFLHENAKICHR